MAMAALCAAATDRFYIEDFSISAGETRTVSIMLDNETAYTAFQTDIYLPEGLIVEQEDGDYIFDLTSRKGRDHNIASQVQADGAIRIMSYSPSIKTYSGNSGALVTFNVTATGNAGGETTIELKNTLFTTKTGTEVAFNDETCHVNIPLKDLSGVIIFTLGGETTEVLDSDHYLVEGDYAESKTSYQYVDICYTGPENVSYSIVVNGIDLFDEEANEEYEYTIDFDPQWIDEINGYRIQLNDLIPLGPMDEYWFSAYYYFEVSIHANGYNSLSENEYIEYYIPRPSPDMDIKMTDFNVVFTVNSDMPRKILLANGEVVMRSNGGENDYGVYVIERTDESYWITVQAGAKTMLSEFFTMTSPESVYIPAKNNGLEIQQCGQNGEISEDGNNHYALIRYYGDYLNYNDEDENETVHEFLEWFDVGINGHRIHLPEWEDDDSICLVIDNDTFVVNEDNGVFNYGPVSYRPNIDGVIIDLLPFGDTYGGKYDIDARAQVYDDLPIYYMGGEYEVEAEAHLEYYVPIEAPTITTQMTNDAVIVNMSSDMDYMKLIVDGEEVLELPYVAGRTYNDYSITVLAGHSPDSVRWVWTEETSILIPAKEVPLLRGDVDGDGSVSISDVTALIDYLLVGNDALIPGKADVDMNGTITIADVTTLIDYLLSGRWPGETFFEVNGVTFKLVDIDGGIYSMGATPEQGENANDNEKPVHQVALSPFSLSVTEVTQELWLTVMGTNPSKFSSNLKRPVENVSWNDCQVFIARLNELTGQNFRLPTEAEWEFAARGGMKSQGYKYSGSDDLNEIAWYNYNAYAVGSSSPDYGTHAAATKAANELGLYDMTGNVWEWCQDWSGDYSDADQINPTGPETGTNRVIRGGGWTNYPKLLRVAARSSYKPGFIGNFIGFRLAL